MKVHISLTKDGGRLLDWLVSHKGGTKSTVVEEAIRRLASGYGKDATNVPR